jgi:hypothetical protein
MVGLSVVLAATAIGVSGFWPSALAHLVAAAVIAGLAWFFLVRRTLGVFPRTMRTAAELLLRRDPILQPLLTSMVWAVLGSLVTVAVPWPDLVVVAALATYAGYVIGLRASHQRLRGVTADAQRRRRASWTNAAASRGTNPSSS